MVIAERFFQPPPGTLFVVTCMPILPSRRRHTMHGTYQTFSARETGQSVARLEALAQLMDGAFILPGTNIRLGLDALVGLIPVAGDLISGLISSYLIWEARRLGAPSWLIARMIANTLLDTVVGAVPVLGDAFDVAFRANMKNMALLRRYIEKHGITCPGGKVIDGEVVRVG
jgi:hypothetical protein